MSIKSCNGDVKQQVNLFINVLLFKGNSNNFTHKSLFISRAKFCSVSKWAWKLHIFNRKPEVQTEGVKFERYEYIPDKEGLMKRC